MATNSQRGEDFDFKNLAWQVLVLPSLGQGVKLARKMPFKGVKVATCATLAQKL